MQSKYERCPNCMQLLNGNSDTCPHCSFSISNYEEISNGLKPFTILQNKYMVGRAIGVGGFGITYIGWDLNLQMYIAIKEYFPESLAWRDSSVSLTEVMPNTSKKDVYDKGLKRYVEEARNISRFYDLQGIVSVKDFFYENGTGYIVMEYINGVTLKEYLKSAGGRLNEATVLSLMKPVLESLSQIHNSGLVHRDISPDNIMVDQKNRIKLIDFGAARAQASAEDKTYTVILKHGYAPVEQYYAKGNQGAWTDVYSICATMYKMLTGQTPPNSIERMENDKYIPPSALGISVSPRTEQVLYKGLAIRCEDRYQNVSQMLADLYGNPMMANNTVTVSPNKVIQNTVNQDSEKKNGVVIAAITIVSVVLIVAIVALAVGMNKNKSDKKTETTTNASTRHTTEDTEEDIKEDTTEDTEEENDDVKETDSVLGVSFKIPEGYVIDETNTDEDSLTYVHYYDGSAFFVAVDNKNYSSEETMVEAFDAQIHSVFGDQCTSSTVSYNGNTGTEWNTDAADGSYDGRSMVICDGTMLIYVEYVTYYGTLDDYTEVMESITY